MDNALLPVGLFFSLVRLLLRRLVYMFFITKKSNSLCHLLVLSRYGKVAAGKHDLLIYLFFEQPLGNLPTSTAAVTTVAAI